MATSPLASLISLSLLFLPSLVSGCYTRLFAFGDSLTDTGNFLHSIGDQPDPVAQLPYGQTFFARPIGRFSDGRIIVDFIATVVNSTKKALRWLHHMSGHGDPAARRAFILSDSFMRRIAPNLGIDVSDLPEVETLPVTKSPAEGMPVPASGVGSGVEGLTTESEEAGDREREMEVEGRGMVEEIEGAVARGEIDREWDGVGGRITGVYLL